MTSAQDDSTQQGPQGEESPEKKLVGTARSRKRPGQSEKQE